MFIFYFNFLNKDLINLQKQYFQSIDQNFVLFSYNFNTYIQIQDHLFKGCLINWNIDNQEELAKTTSPFGQILQIEDTKQIKGNVTITNQTGKQYQYDSLQIDLVQAIWDEGLIQILFTEKISQLQAGAIAQQANFQFQSKEKKLPYTTILCLQQKVHLLTYLQLTFRRRREENVSYFNFGYIAPNHMEQNPIKIEVGAENALQVEISVPNTNIDILNGILYANVHFVTAQKKMKEMKVGIKRKETIPEKEYVSEEQQLYSMQAMDGTPFRNEIIPIRIQMNKIKDIGCSYDSDKAKIQYILLVSVVTVDDQNYFKDVQLTLYCDKEQIQNEESSEEQIKSKKSKKSRKE